MSTYSFKRNLQYMVMAFTHPTLLVDDMRQESSILFGVVPFVIEKTLYEFAYLLDSHLGHSLSLVQASPLLGSEYYQYKPLLAPLLEIADLCIFALVITGLARLHRYQGFDTIKTTAFFMFLATFGLLAFPADMIYTYAWALDCLLWIHPLVGAVVLVYLTVFVQRQTKITRWRSFALVLPAWMAYFASRIPFLV
jgi:hypothetical protein